jgi:hypothetical protein
MKEMLVDSSELASFLFPKPDLCQLMVCLVKNDANNGEMEENWDGERLNLH